MNPLCLLLGHQPDWSCRCTATCNRKGCDWSNQMDWLIVDCDAHAGARQRLVDALDGNTG